MNVNCDGNKNIREAIINNYKSMIWIFNFTQFECRIKNLINLPMIKKKLNVFFLFPSF